MAARGGRTAAFVTALGVTRAVYEVLRERAPGGPEFGRRTNYAGRTVDLYAGPATALGAAAGAAVPAGARGAVVLAVLAAAACGAYDDRAGAGDPRRGFRAHLTALRAGEMTSGAVKLLGIGAAALVAGGLLKERPVDRILAGVVIAGSAHCVNLLDVRPGRACAGVLALGAPGLLRRGTAGALAAVPVGAAAAVIADDLGERTMLGDTGAHALGAVRGPVRSIFAGPRRLAPHLAALSESPKYVQYEGDPPPCDVRHQTPRADPRRSTGQDLAAAVVASNGRAGLAVHALGVVAATAYGDRVGRRASSPM